MAFQKSKLKQFNKEVKFLAPWLKIDKNKTFKKLRELVPEELYKMSEFSFSPLSPDLGIMVKGKGKDYIENLASFMAFTGLSPEGVEFFKETDRHFPDIEASLKVDFAPEKKVKLSFYHHCLIPKELAGIMMKKINIDNNSINYFLNVIAFLMREKDLYVGFGFKSDGTVGLKGFFCSSIGKRGPALCPGIASVMAKLNLSVKHISLFIDLHNFLAADPKRNVFTSLVFTDKLESMIKIDYENAPVVKVLEIYKTFAMPEEEIKRLSLASEKLGMENLSYLGIKYINEKPPVFKAYFTRRYALEDDPAHVAELMQNTMWVNKSITHD